MFQLLEEIEGAKTIGIGGHIRPDGDCVGACMALYLYLKKCVEPDVSVSVYLEEPSEVFRTIEALSEIRTNAEGETAPDVFFALDCDSERLGVARSLFLHAKKKINIDHHISNEGCGGLDYIDPQVGSTSELVYRLFDKRYVDAQIAKAVYIGIIHDTGVFQYSNTSPETLRVAAELIGYGFDFAKLIEKTFYEKTYVQNQIMGRALLESILLLDGRCIVSAVDRKLMEFYQVTSKDLDGIVNQLRNTSGVECAIFMYEVESMEYKVSLRSTDKVDVAQIASYFGGGGHKRAAGCMMFGTFHDVTNNLSLHIERQLNGEEQ